MRGLLVVGSTYYAAWRFGVEIPSFWLELLLALLASLADHSRDL